MNRYAVKSVAIATLELKNVKGPTHVFTSGRNSNGIVYNMSPHAHTPRAEFIILYSPL